MNPLDPQTLQCPNPSATPVSCERGVSPSGWMVSKEPFESIRTPFYVSRIVPVGVPNVHTSLTRDTTVVYHLRLITIRTFHLLWDVMGRTNS